MPFTDTTACRAVATALLATAALALTTACHDLSVHRAGSPGGVSPAPTSTSREDGENLSPGPDGRVACTPEMLRFHAGAMPRRTHRMLLTVTNSSGRTCHFAAQRYPLLRFGDDRQPTLPAIAASRPSTAVSLAPGDTAYATITTSAAGGPGGKAPPGPENLPVRRRTDRPAPPPPRSAWTAAPRSMSTRAPPRSPTGSRAWTPPGSGDGPAAARGRDAPRRSPFGSHPAISSGPPLPNDPNLPSMILLRCCGMAAPGAVLPGRLSV